MTSGFLSRPLISEPYHRFCCVLYEFSNLYLKCRSSGCAIVRFSWTPGQRGRGLSVTVPSAYPSPSGIERSLLIPLSWRDYPNKKAGNAYKYNLYKCNDAINTCRMPHNTEAMAWTDPTTRSSNYGVCISFTTMRFIFNIDKIYYSSLRRS